MDPKFAINQSTSLGLARVNSKDIIPEETIGDLRFSNNPIFLLGVPRSGSTWVASTLACANNIIYSYEPFSPQKHDSNLFSNKSDLIHNKFLDYVESVFTGKKYISNNALMHQRIQSKEIQRLLVKDVHSYAYLELISTLKTKYNSQLVFLFRHPCGTINSWLGAFKDIVKVEKNITSFLSNEVFTDQFNKYLPIIRSAKDDIEKRAVYYGITNKLLLNGANKNPGSIIVKHEDFCKNPVQSFKDLFSQLEMEWSEEVEKQISVTSNTKSDLPFLAFRQSDSEADKWKTSMPQSQIDTICSIVKEFELGLYSDI